MEPAKYLDFYESWIHFPPSWLETETFSDKDVGILNEIEWIMDVKPEENTLDFEERKRKILSKLREITDTEKDAKKSDISSSELSIKIPYEDTEKK